MFYILISQCFFFFISDYIMPASILRRRNRLMALAFISMDKDDLAVWQFRRDPSNTYFFGNVKMWW